MPVLAGNGLVVPLALLDEEARFSPLLEEWCGHAFEIDVAEGAADFGEADGARFHVCGNRAQEVPVGLRRHEEGRGLFALFEDRVVVGELPFHHEGVAEEASARAAPEGEAVAGALSQCVVDVAFAGAVGPVVVGEPAPVLVREVFNRAREHVGFLRLTGGGRELPVRDVARKRRLFKDVELIEVGTVDA